MLEEGKWAMGKCDITGFEFLGKWQPLGVTPTWGLISSPGVRSRRVTVKPTMPNSTFTIGPEFKIFHCSCLENLFRICYHTEMRLTGHGPMCRNLVENSTEEGNSSSALPLPRGILYGGARPT